MKIKKIEKMEKKYYSDKKNPTKLSWPMSAKSDKNFYSKRKKNTKLSLPISAKSDTYHDLYITKQDFFGSPLKTFPLEIVKLIEKLEKIKKNMRTWGCETSRFQVMGL